MPTLIIEIDLSEWNSFMEDMAEATARLDDVPDDLWNRMCRLDQPDSAGGLIGASAYVADGRIACSPTPEALSILATLRALGASDGR